MHVIIYCFFLFSLSHAANITEIFKSAFNIDEFSAKILETLKGHKDDLITAFKMVDASGKIVAGLPEGNRYVLGNLDECHNIQSGDIYGKYCLGTWFFQRSLEDYLKYNKSKNFQIQPQSTTTNISLQIEICMPSSWVVEELSTPFNFSEDRCTLKKKASDLSVGTLTTLTVFAIFGLIIVCSTFFDLYLYYFDKESPHELFVAFSFWTNGRKLFCTAKNPDQFLCLNGIRALSMMWVILFHEFSLILKAATQNHFDLENFQKDPASMFVTNGTLSVDSFFVIAGFVNVYSYLKSQEKKVKFNIFLFYVHRYLRLTPVLLIVVLIHLFLLPFIEHDPVWNVVIKDFVKICEDNWWATLLYINNYAKDGTCVCQTWYLSVDTQLFVLSPIILILLSKRPIVGLASLGSLIIAGIVVPFVVSYTLDLRFSDSVSYNDFYYITTYARFGPYVIGMALGYLIHQAKTTGWKLNLPTTVKFLVVCSAWSVAVIGLVVCCFAGHDVLQAEYDSRWGTSLFLGFNRSFWALFLSILIFLCITGYGGPVNYFLSLPIFQFLAKVSYSMYLIHMVVVLVRLSATKTYYQFSTFIMMYIFWSDFMVTLFLSIILCLAFESPVIIIEKHLFGKGKSKLADTKIKA